jgi:hypothetical protein
MVYCKLLRRIMFLDFIHRLMFPKTEYLRNWISFQNIVFSETLDDGQSPKKMILPSVIYFSFADICLRVVIIFTLSRRTFQKTEICLEMAVSLSGDCKFCFSNRTVLCPCSFL